MESECAQCYHIILLPGGSRKGSLAVKRVTKKAGLQKRRCPPISMYPANISQLSDPQHTTNDFKNSNKIVRGWKVDCLICNFFLGIFQVPLAEEDSLHLLRKLLVSCLFCPPLGCLPPPISKEACFRVGILSSKTGSVWTKPSPVPYSAKTPCSYPTCTLMLKHPSGFSSKPPGGA